MLVGNRRFYLNSKTSKKGWSPEDVMEDVDHIIAPSPADYIQQKFNEKTGRLFYINSKTGKKGWAMEDVMDDSGEPVEEDTQPRVAGTVRGAPGTGPPPRGGPPGGKGGPPGRGPPPRGGPPGPRGGKGGGKGPPPRGAPGRGPPPRGAPPDVDPRQSRGWTVFEKLASVVSGSNPMHQDRPVTARARGARGQTVAVGGRVTVQGLKSAAAQHRNGMVGAVQSFDASSGRYTVLLDDGNTLALKPDNLSSGNAEASAGGAEVAAEATAEARARGQTVAVGGRVEVQGLKSAAAQHRNGMVGAVQSFDASSGRYIVLLDDGNTLALNPDNLQLSYSWIPFRVPPVEGCNFDF